MNLTTPDERVGILTVDPSRQGGDNRRVPMLLELSSLLRVFEVQVKGSTVVR
jgi:hypothetical protein